MAREEETVFSSGLSYVLETWEELTIAAERWRNEVVAWQDETGFKLWGVRSYWTDDEVTGIEVTDPIPPGWRKRVKDECLTPQRGPAGEEARALLRRFKPPRIRTTLHEKYGVPEHVFTGDRVRQPALALYGEELWVRFLASYDNVGWDGGVSFVRRKLSEYWAAREAHDAD